MAHSVSIYPHNDLFNLAHYQREIINKKINEGVEDAISLDCMSCLISLAFTVEALVNFVGYKRIEDWQERNSFKDKIKQVYSGACIELNETVDPYKTIWELKKLRDEIAHGKPVELNVDVNTREELRTSMECPWDINLNTKYVNHAYEQVKYFEKLLIDSYKITFDETLTSVVKVN